MNINLKAVMKTWVSCLERFNFGCISEYTEEDHSDMSELVLW